MKMILSEIAKAIDATCNNDKFQDLEICGVEFDSRKIEAGSLFVPLMGERDGHDFITKAMDGGALASLWQADHGAVPQDFPVLKVENTLVALQKLAQYYLRKVDPKVVAISGSNGKTTTKDMIAGVLGHEYNVHATNGNFNNEIGVPMTILQMRMNTEILVLEMGMDRPGQLDYLSKLVQPDVAVLTMIGEAHIEFFGTREKIAEAKMEITHGLKEDGIFIYNGDEPLLTNLATSVEQEQKTFGFNSTNTIFADRIQSYKRHASFYIQTSEDKFRIPLIGKHNVSNTLAAILVGEHFHEKLTTINKALANFTPTQNRMQWRRGDAGEDILDDIYNSNPTAALAVLKSFSAVHRKKSGQRIVVLADMLELGEHAPELHAELAREIDPKHIDQVFLYGALMENLATALKPKFSPAKLHHFEKDQQQLLINELRDNIHEDDIVMLKGSHSMNLDHVLDSLL